MRDSPGSARNQSTASSRTTTCPLGGLDVLDRVRAIPELPFILVTEQSDDEVANEAISAGATDYFQKQQGTDQYTMLATRIDNAVEQYRSQRALDASRERLSLFIDKSPLGVIE